MKKLSSFLLLLLVVFTAQAQIQEPVKFKTELKTLSGAEAEIVFTGTIDAGWHEQNMTSPAYTASMKRYFEISKAMPHSPILSLKEGKISHYDNLFKKYAQEIGWDWRLLASLAYTESNFDTTAVSWVGAKGLMQLMPATARAMGVPPGKEQNPEESIKAAVKYIAATDRSLSMVPDKQERIKFILASYNAGLGHIFDAIALADKYGKNKTVWTDNVENYILLKSNEEYFTDPFGSFIFNFSELYYLLYVAQRYYSPWNFYFYGYLRCSFPAGLFLCFILETCYPSGSDGKPLDRDYR
jgi:hypothetical protein